MLSLELWFLFPFHVTGGHQSRTKLLRYYYYVITITSLILRNSSSLLPPAVSFDRNFIVVGIIGGFIRGTDHNTLLPEVAICWISLLELRARVFFHIEW